MESTLPGTATATPRSQPFGSAWRWTVRLAILAPLVWLVGTILYIVVGANFHTVIPGEIHRCAQVDASRLDAYIVGYGLRTVVNLRGRGDGMEWYENESRVCQKHGVSLENLTLSASRLPSRTELRRLIDIIEHSERPLIFHCRQGADRTGLATAAALLLRPGVDYADARSRMSLRWGHWHWGPAGELSRFFQQYERWLKDEGRAHSPESFRYWACERYDAGRCRYEIVQVTPLFDVPRVGRPLGFRIRYRNTSSEPWRLTPHARAGVHPQIELYPDESDKACWAVGGLLDKMVQPGEEIDLTIATTPLVAGRHRLRIDLIDGERGAFFKLGEEPLEQELIVRE